MTDSHASRFVGLNAVPPMSNPKISFPIRLIVSRTLTPMALSVGITRAPPTAGLRWSKAMSNASGTSTFILESAKGNPSGPAILALKNIVPSSNGPGRGASSIREI